MLVNNAGIKRDGALHNMDPVAWHEVIDTNLTGTFNYSRAVMKQLIRHGGSVVNITSVSGIIGMAGQTNYSASKAGVIGFTKALAQGGRALRRAGQRDRAGLYRHGHDRGHRRERPQETVRADSRWAKPARATRLRGLALYLAGEDAGYITGQVLERWMGACQ